MMKRLILFAAIFIVFSGNSVLAAPKISAEYACVMEAETGTVIYEYNGYEQHSMASTTKIMTALVALESCEVDEMVTVSRNAAYQEGSSAYLAQGEKIKMLDLLYGLMLNSGNDAAVAVAEHVSGTEATFAQLMTEKAKNIGAFDTSFKNASGLDAQGHYTTAVDLAKITSYALKNDTFRQIVSQKYKEVEYSGGKLCFSNHNKLLKQYDGCIGVKTGYTKKTGRCLVSAAERNGVTIICVTLRAPDDWNDHKALLDFGFENVEMTLAVQKGQVLKYIPAQNKTEISAVAAEKFVVPSIKGQKNKTELILHTVPNIDESVAKGEKVGWCEVRFDGNFLYKMDILAGETYIRKKTLLESIMEFWRNLFS